MLAVDLQQFNQVLTSLSEQLQRGLHAGNSLTGTRMNGTR